MLLLLLNPIQIRTNINTGKIIMKIMLAILLAPILINGAIILQSPAEFIRNYQIETIAENTGSHIKIIGDSVFLKIPDKYAGGTDNSCANAALLFHSICSLDKNILLHVSRLSPPSYWIGSGSLDSGENRIYDHWIPSAVNPMTIAWTKTLSED